LVQEFWLVREVVPGIGMVGSNEILARLASWKTTSLLLQFNFSSMTPGCRTVGQNAWTNSLNST